MSHIVEEIKRLEYVLATLSIDHGRGANPFNLDIAFMERSVVLLRAYRDLHNRDADYDAVMKTVCDARFGNMAESDPVIAAIREDILTP